MAETELGYAGFSVVLPIELWYHIIELLRHDPYSLLTCALTCWAWSRRSTRLLQPMTITQLESGLSADQLISRVRAHPDITACTTFVGVHCASGQSTWPSALAMQIQSRYKRLHSLSLGSVDFNTAHPTILTCLGAFRAVVHLWLSSCKFSSFPSLVRFITSFPKLDDLLVENVGWVQHQNLPNVFRRQRSKKLALGRFGITVEMGSMDYVPMVVDWLLKSTSSAESLTQLTLKIHAPIGRVSIKSLLQSCINISILRFDVSASLITSLLDEISIFHLLSLTELRVGYFKLYDAAAVRSMLPNTSCNISALTFWVIMTDADLFALSNWEVLDSVLVSDLSHISASNMHPWFYNEDKTGKISPTDLSEDEMNMWLPGWSARNRNEG